MQKTIFRLWLGLLIVVISSSGCKTLKNIGLGNNKARGAKAILSKTEKEVVNFNTMALSGKAKVNLPMANLENASATYRISIDDENKKILIRVTVLIVEVARVLLTEDSIYIQDKFNKKFISCDYSLAEAYTGLQGDFGTVRDLILGNFNPIPDDLELGTDSKDPLIFSGEKAGTNFKYSIDPTIHKIKKIEATNASKGQTVEVNYSDFEPYGDTEMPQEIKVSVTTSEATGIEFAHRKVQIDPSRISFKLSSGGNYEKQNCQ